MVERLSSPAVGAPLPAQPVAPTARTGDPRLESFQRTLATMLGSQVPVAVLARLQDGSYMTRVLDTPVRMQLPPGTQAGAQLNMTVLAASPQPTFGLGDATLHGTLLPLSAPAASLAAAVAAAASPFAQTGGQPQSADLSPAARLLSQVLHSAAQGGGAAAVQSSVPLAPQGTPDPAQLASQLQGAVAKSGLFYESHLGEWAEGKRPLAELMAEPQAQKAPGTPATEPALARLIQQQLATHENGQFVWQGQLGPGQALRWDVVREDEGGPAAGRGEDEGPGWKSGLRLRFAALGEIEAALTLRGGRLQIALEAAPAAAGLLRADAPRLQEALAAAGTELAALRIQHREVP